jgi:hypothetical protein
MKPLSSLSRRSLLWAAGLAALSPGSLDPGPAIGARNTCERMRNRLVSLLHEPARASTVGAVYLQSPVGQRSPPLTLVKTVLAEMGPDAGKESMRLHIAGRIRRELHEARVISLDGWIMSPTEAWLCGLAAAG